MRKMGLQERSQFRRSFNFEVSSVKKGKVPAGPNWVRLARGAPRPSGPVGARLGFVSHSQFPCFRSCEIGAVLGAPTVGDAAWCAPYESLGILCLGSA